MQQETYNIIVKVLQNGAPALANDLIQSINNVLAENRKLALELSKLMDEKTTEETVKEEK